MDRFISPFSLFLMINSPFALLNSSALAPALEQYNPR